MDLLEYASHRLVLRKHSREPWAFTSGCSAPKQLELLLLFKEKNTGLLNETHRTSCDKPQLKSCWLVRKFPSIQARISNARFTATPLEKRCCLGSASTFHSEQYLDMNYKRQNENPNQSTEYCGQQRQTGSRDNVREKERPKRNQTPRCREQGRACKGQCHVQCHTDLAREGYVKLAARWLEERCILQLSTSTTAGTASSHQGNPH